MISCTDQVDVMDAVRNAAAEKIVGVSEWGGNGFSVDTRRGTVEVLFRDQRGVEGDASDARIIRALLAKLDKAGTMTEAEFEAAALKAIEAM
jgi:hypothetical protein